jgi:two-component system cell cycle response regulator
VTAVRALRRAFAVSLGALAGAGACALVASGTLDGASLLASPPALVPTAALAGLLLLVLVTLSRRLGFEAPTARAQRASRWLAAADDLADVEVSLALIAAAHAVVAVTGGADSSLYPLLYAVVAFAVTLSSRAGAVAAVTAAIGLEVAAVVRAADWRDAAPPAAVHVAFLAGAAAAHALLLRGLARRLRRRQTEALARGFAAEREAARDYRLIASALGPSSRAPRGRDEEERLLAAGGAQIIGDQAAWIVATLKRWLGARSVALVWLADDERLVLREIASDADDVTERRQLGSAGVLGAVVRDRAPVLVAATKAGQLPYYEGRSGTGAAFLGVPVLEGPHLRGILCADRDRAFDEADRDLLLDACAQILRTVQSEHVFRAVERSKYEYERFYQAAALLGRALTPEQVMETAFDAAAAIVDYDAAVIALYQRDQARHRVAAVRVRPGGEGVLEPRELDGLEFKDNAGLAAMVVKNRHYLPAGGEPREVSAPIYTRKVKLSDARSLLVLPLLSGEEAIGTFTLAARAEKRFGKDVREMLAVIGNQVAISLENGLLYKKMETMATTDGLTGLTNHRTFQDRFANLLERASRHGQKIAFLLCDVDFFKKVNDNYGHPTGDEVLRRVARVLGEVARKIDIPARYGGEEFAIVLDGTDVEQARQVAERVRQEISKLVIESEKGPFQVTMSIGVATFPDDGRDRAALIEHADHALYHAKHSGRNQVVTYPQYLAAKSGKTIEPPPAPKQRKAS